MNEISVQCVSGSAPENDLPPDLEAMKQAADEVLDAEVVPRYEDLMSSIKELRGMIPPLIDHVDACIDAGKVENPGYALTCIAEGRYRMCCGVGAGLKSAHHCARGLANALKDLVDLFPTQTPQPPT